MLIHSWWDKYRRRRGEWVMLMEGYGAACLTRVLPVVIGVKSCKDSVSTRFLSGFLRFRLSSLGVGVLFPVPCAGSMTATG